MHSQSATTKKMQKRERENLFSSLVPIYPISNSPKKQLIFLISLNILNFLNSIKANLDICPPANFTRNIIKLYNMGTLLFLYFSPYNYLISFRFVPYFFEWLYQLKYIIDLWRVLCMDISYIFNTFEGPQIAHCSDYPINILIYISHMCASKFGG